MDIEFKSPRQLANEYLLHLKSLKPSVDTKQEDSDWYIKGNVNGGLISGVYSDQRKIADDAFPQSARREAVERHLFVHFNDGFKQETKSNGFALVTGSTGSFANAGTIEFVYEPNGNTYTNTEDVTIDAATGTPVAITSINTGQSQNLLEDAELSLSSPPSGFDNVAIVFGGPLADGSNIESTEEASARVLDRVRDPVRGGTGNDYEQWALESSDSVTRASVLRYVNGLGTVGVVITAGTTDIDTAIDNDEPIVIVPSSQLISEVKSYLDTKRPVTDCVRVLPPIETDQEISVKVRFSQGTKDTILAGQTLTQGELVQREVRRALYKHPVGGFILGASGYVVASHIEEVIDLNLSTLPHTQGSNPIVVDRHVEDLSASGRNRVLLTNQAAVPSVINILEF